MTKVVKLLWICDRFALFFKNCLWTEYTQFGINLWLLLFWSIPKMFTFSYRKMPSLNKNEQATFMYTSDTSIFKQAWNFYTRENENLILEMYKYLRVVKSVNKVFRSQIACGISFRSIYSIRVALFPKILFKIVILHNIKRLFPKDPKFYEFSKKIPIWRWLILTL